MKNEILSAAAREKISLSPEALEILDSAGYDFQMVNTILTAVSKNNKFVTKQDIEDYLSGDTGLMKSEKVIPYKLEHNIDINVVPGTDITGESTCTGKIEDLAKYIQARFKILKNIVSRRPECRYWCTIEHAKEVRKDITIIAMIYSLSKTKNGNLLIKLEDETGVCDGFINKTSPLINTVLVTDEVVGLTGSFSAGGLFIIDRIYFPSVKKDRQWEVSDTDSKVAFISDIHVGSKEFLREGWKNMVRWLKHNHEQENIRYMVIAGDVVDGIGVYPDQESDLYELDIYDQYNETQELLKEIPDDIHMILQPGNHDACRLAEPQPALSKIYTSSFDSHVNIVGNPISLNIENRLVTSYHGKSFDDWINSIRGAKYETPLLVMEQMIEKRHLAPIYGQKNALAPEQDDYLALKVCPDILVTGHIHNIGTEDYKGVKLINQSTYQQQTSYQADHNFVPAPCILPIVDLGSGRIIQKNFQSSTTLSMRRGDCN